MLPLWPGRGRRCKTEPEFEFLVTKALIGGLNVGAIDHVTTNSFRLYFVGVQPQFIMLLELIIHSEIYFQKITYLPKDTSLLIAAIHLKSIQNPPLPTLPLPSHLRFPLKNYYKVPHCRFSYLTHTHKLKKITMLYTRCSKVVKTTQYYKNYKYKN